MKSENDIIDFGGGFHLGWWFGWFTNKSASWGGDECVTLDLTGVTSSPPPPPARPHGLSPVVVSFLPSAVMPTCSELQLGWLVGLWETLIVTFGGDLRELRFEESGGERCLTGTACTEPRLYRDMWTYIKCEHVCECSIGLALVWTTGKTSKHGHIVLNHCSLKQLPPPC